MGRAVTTSFTRRKKAMFAVPGESPRASADSSERTSDSPGQQARATTPGTDFGPNEWLVDELYQRYLADPGSVDMAWWSFFADYSPPGGATRPGPGTAARRRGQARGQHGRQPQCPDRDQRPVGPGQAADRQPDRDQQPPGPGPGRQGLVHTPHRVRAGPGARGGPGDEPRL